MNRLTDPAGQAMRPFWRRTTSSCRACSSAPWPCWPPTPGRALLGLTPASPGGARSGRAGHLMPTSATSPGMARFLFQEGQ
jgi:hypothetical protein